MRGRKSRHLPCFLIGAMGKSVRRRVKEVTCDLSPSMVLIAAEVFYNAHVVNDRFHVQQVYNEAVDEIRVDIRRQLIADDNARDRSEPPVTYSNGETMRRILARSKHTLMMAQNKWTDIQRHRANIRFRHYPRLNDAYRLAMELRRIFKLKISPTKAMGKKHAPTILNYFRRRATHAFAEAFNSKVKIFRAQMRGVRDRDFFIFLLVKLYA